jgi:hypothetical protein
MTDDEPKPRSKKKKRRRAPRRDEHVRYIVAIETWDWGYTFGLAGLKDSLDPYMEHRLLKLTGKLLRPIDPKIETVDIWLLPSADLDEEKRRDHQPTAIGSLSLRNGILSASLGIPKDSLTPILQMLVAERFKLVDISGARLRYREARVRSFSLEIHIDEDDMPSIGEPI